MIRQLSEMPSLVLSLLDRSGRRVPRPLAKASSRSHEVRTASTLSSTSKSPSDWRNSEFYSD